MGVDELEEVEWLVQGNDPPGKEFACMCYNGDGDFTQCWHSNRNWGWPSENKVTIPGIYSGRGRPYVGDPIIKLKSVNAQTCQPFNWAPHDQLNASMAYKIGRFGLGLGDMVDEYPF